MVRNIHINKRTTVKAVVTNTDINHPVTGYEWTLDKNLQPNTNDTLELPPYSIVGDQHTVSCKVTNDCGFTDLSETLKLIDPNAPVIIIQNGSFDTDLTGWIFDQSNSVGTASVVNGEAVVNMTSIPQGSMNSLSQNGIVLNPNTNYMLKFDAYTTNLNVVVNHDIEVYLHDNLPTIYPAGHYIIGNDTDIILSPLKTTHTRLFSTGATVPANIKLRFKFMNTGSYYFDNVIIEDLTAPCPIPTCEFIITTS